MSREVKTIFLDVDETLSDGVSWLKLTQGLGASVEKHVEIFDQFKQGLLSYEESKRQLLDIWKSSGNANKAYIEAMFRSWPLKEGAEDTVNYLKEMYMLCVISGSVDLYVGIVAEKLGISDWYASAELVWDEKGNLVDFHYSRDQEGKKVEQADEYIFRRNLDKGRCAAVGDGDNDKGLFRQFRYGVAVNKNPSTELKSLVFKTVKSLRELREIF